MKNLSIEEPRHLFPSDLTVKRPETLVDLSTKTVKENIEKKPPSLAPFREHPLFYFIQNMNTLPSGKVFKIRSSNSVKEADVTTLILKPQATAVAGVEGKAISNPLSRAILRKNSNADILFEPQAVAIAGPGGIAHAQSDLEISYDYS